jgi:hypothetical protein
VAGVLIFPLGHGMGDDIDRDLCVVTPADMQIGIGAFDGQRVRIALPLPYGRWATADVSLSMFLTAADAFVLAHGDPRVTDSCPRCGSKV